MKNRIAALTLLLTATPLLAHEVWLDASAYQLEIGETLQADLKNGEGFVGSPLIFNPNRFTRFDITVGNMTSNVDGTIGDRPALQATAATQGLYIAGYESTVSTVRYATWGKFQSFADHKDFTDMRARHDARGLPLEDFREAYTRHVKMLACVGTCDGADRPLGLQTEIVALKNPYRDDLAGGLPIQLLYQNAPQADRQIEIFAKAADGTVTITTERTDANGIALIRVAPDTTYLLDAVTVREPSAALAQSSQAVWETLWAALTFQTPQ
ncbi:DUF4198 domain-containing protein [Nereida sp. MMG025]|uniref:DUF4198 domain-containing protein n=1 Tax=Nereida sp. MMG025 TaxID=2909981 RepID=UPI001F46652D|nr:DUF4198 domain-containing protein [Nereida sp. MMG025]MCF6443297.1 DUF4198 domain-containing protein [Nereida sp. MMG025]